MADQSSIANLTNLVQAIQAGSQTMTKQMTALIAAVGAGNGASIPAASVGVIDLVVDYSADRSGNIDIVPQLEAAQAALPSGGGVIWLRPGLYRMDSGFAATKPGVTIRGSGWGNTICFPHASGAFALFDLRAQGQTISDLQINGEGLVAPANIGLKLSTAAANIIVERLFIVNMALGLWCAEANDARISTLRIQNCAEHVVEGRGGAGVFASEIQFHDIALVPNGQNGMGWVIDYNAFSNEHELITCQGAQIGLHITCSVAHNGTTVFRPDGHWFGGNFNIDHAQLAACQIDSGQYIQFGEGTLTGTQAGPGLLIQRAGADAATNSIDGIICNGTEIAGNVQHGVDWESGGNVRLFGCMIYGNGALVGNTYDGVHVGAGAAGQLEILDNNFGPSQSGTAGWGNLVTQQRYAMRLESGALTNVGSWNGGGTLHGNLHIEGNTRSAQGTAFISDLSAAETKYIAAGQNPSGPTAVLVGASPWTYTAGGSPEILASLTNGAISSVAVNGVSTRVNVNGLYLRPGDVVVTTYTGAPAGVTSTVL